MADFFPTFVAVTPFGPFCRVCKVTLSIERGILQHGKEAHPHVSFANATVVRAVKTKMQQLQVLHSKDLSMFPVPSSKPKDLWFCSVCFVTYQKNSNFTRHLSGRSTACSIDKGAKMPCFPTICGRMGPSRTGFDVPDQSGVCTRPAFELLGGGSSELQFPTSQLGPPVLAASPSIVSDLTSVSTGRQTPTQSYFPPSFQSAVCLSTNKVPSPLMMTHDEAAAIMAPFVHKDEDVQELSLIFLPLLQQGFEGTIRQFLQFSAKLPNEDPILSKWLATSQLWLSDYAEGHIANVSANVRSRLAEFEQKELDNVVVGTRTFCLRKGITRLTSELDFALRFFFWFPTTKAMGWNPEKRVVKIYRHEYIY